MSLFWIEVKNAQFVELETQQTLKLHDYPMQAAMSGNMQVPSNYEGKVILVSGDRAGGDIYSAEIKGSLLAYEP
jgi:hypothetical protein